MSQFGWENCKFCFEKVGNGCELCEDWIVATMIIGNNCVSSV